jgi:type IV pilus assembly protein PilQ
MRSKLIALWFLLGSVQASELRSVDYAALHPGTALIRIGLTQPLAQPPSGFRTLHPAARVVLDLPGTTFAPERKIAQPERGLVRSIRLLRHGTGTRLVIELAAVATYETVMEGTALLVTLRRTPPARDRIQYFGDLRFERGALGEGLVIVTLPDERAYIDVRQQGRRVIVSFLGTRIEPSRQQRLDVLDFATPINAIEARGAGQDAQLVVETGTPFEYSARESRGEFTLTVAPALREP